MKSTNELLNELVNDSYTVLEEIAKELGCTMTSLTKVTGYGDDAAEHRMAYIVVKTTSQKLVDEFRYVQWIKFYKTMSNRLMDIKGMDRLYK